MRIILTHPNYGQLEHTPDGDEAYNRQLEQVEYLHGILYADPEHRLNADADTDDIDSYGTGTKAFWRGMLEGAGYIAITGTGEKRYPRVELKGSLPVLTKFLAFMQEEVERAVGMPWAWDADGSLAFQAAGGFLRLTGQRAQDICRILYVDQEVGQDSIRHVVDEILTWTTKR